MKQSLTYAILSRRRVGKLLAKQGLSPVLTKQIRLRLFTQELERLMAERARGVKPGG